MFKTKTQREKFMYLLGKQSASSGGFSFGAYRGAVDAFEQVKSQKLYDRVEITDADFMLFQFGFDEFTSYRTALQKIRADNQAELFGILAEVSLSGSQAMVRNYRDVAELLENL